MARSKVKSRLHYDVAHLQPLINVPTKYQLATPYSSKIKPTKFYKSRSLRQGQRSNQGHTMTLHTYNPKPMSLPSVNFLHFTVSEIQPAHPDTMGENNTPTALKGCGVKRTENGQSFTKKNKEQ